MQCEICKKVLPLARENSKWVCIQYCLSEKTKKKFFKTNLVGNITLLEKEEWVEHSDHRAHKELKCLTCAGIQNE
ncbi:hypothetical protein [Mesoplasma melaleucae]|uniref:Uncharacterized protein n=1 Tax=Mesoplasma melaleucae TaxID=81459 RepID=A0A2K8NVF1_9MOLU|nr:hypothetical protein [Mesoplasma melaleucae]ATZ17825.1 hypothetical protein EMELA_v1c02520 [Mesoplasma melaleucae]